MGNDIVGGKVYPVPRVVNIPLHESHDDAVLGQPTVLTASMLTRAQAHKQPQDINLANSMLARFCFI